MIRRKMWIVLIYYNNKKISTIYFKNWCKLKVYINLIKQSYKYKNFSIEIREIYRKSKSLKTIIN